MMKLSHLSPALQAQSSLEFNFVGPLSAARCPVFLYAPPKEARVLDFLVAVSRGVTAGKIPHEPLVLGGHYNHVAVILKVF